MIGWPSTDTMAIALLQSIPHSATNRWQLIKRGVCVICQRWKQAEKQKDGAARLHSPASQRGNLHYYYQSPLIQLQYVLEIKCGKGAVRWYWCDLSSHKLDFLRSCYSLVTVAGLIKGVSPASVHQVSSSCTKNTQKKRSVEFFFALFIFFVHFTLQILKMNWGMGNRARTRLYICIYMSISLCIKDTTAVHRPTLSLQVVLRAAGCEEP